MQTETLMADEGAVPLALRVYAPEGAPPRASVVIGGAFGVRQSFMNPLPAGWRGRAFASPPSTTGVTAIRCTARCAACALTCLTGRATTRP